MKYSIKHDDKMIKIRNHIYKISSHYTFGVLGNFNNIDIRYEFDSIEIQIITMYIKSNSYVSIDSKRLKTKTNKINVLIIKKF